MAYNPQDDGIVIAKPLGALGFPIDSRSTYVDKINILRRPFISLNEVLDYFDTPLKREGGFIIYVNDTGVLQPDGTILGGEDKTYWFKQGTEDENLVPFAEKGDKGDQGNPGPQGEAFTYDDFTPEQIEELQQPAIDAAVIANTAALNANDKAVIAQNAATSANTAATTANTATTNANNATTTANTATTQANTARDNANAAAIVANNARGWSPDLVGEADGVDRQVFKLRSWINGTGTQPTDNVGLYLKDDGTYTAVKADAGNFKGEKGNNGIATPNINAGKLVGRTTVGFGSAEEITPIGFTLKDGKVYNGVESGSGNTKINSVSNIKDGLLMVDGDTVGALKVNLPLGRNITMYTLEGTISLHDGTSTENRTCTFTITAYPYVINYGASAVFKGAFAPNFIVRFFNSDTQPYFTIGELTQDWSFLGFSIDRVQGKYFDTSLELSTTGFSASIITSFGGATPATIRLNNLPQSNQHQTITSIPTMPATSIIDGDTKLQIYGKIKALFGQMVKNTGSASNLVLGDGTYKALADLAPLASPEFTGTPSLPTGTIAVKQTLGDNTDKLATTSFVAEGLATKAPIREDIVTVTGNKTFALTDENTFQDVTATANLTVPLNSSVAFPVGTEIEGAIRDTITGTFVATGGVTIINKSLIVAGLTAFTLKKVATDTWLLTTNASSGGGTTILTAGTTLNDTDILTNRYKDITVTGAALNDIVDISSIIRRNQSNQYFLISGEVISTNTVRIYISQSSTSFSSALPAIDPFTTPWVVGLTVTKKP